MADKEFNPDEYLAQKEFNPDEYIAEKKGKVTVEAAPEEESMLPKLGTLKGAAKSAERMAIAVAKPPAAIAEMLGWGAPAKQLLARDEQLKEEAGLGGKASSLAGDVMGYMLPSAAISKGAQAIKAIPEIAKLTSKLQAYKPLSSVNAMAGNQLVKTSAAGAAGTLLNPVGLTPDEEGYGEERAKQAAVGAAAGPVVAGAAKGVASMMDPALKRIAELRAQGIDVDKLIKGDTTLGQLLGGAAQKLENWGQVLPLSGLRPKVEAGAKEMKNALETRTDELGQTARTAIGDIGRETNETIAKQRAAIEAKNAALGKKQSGLAAQEEASMSQGINESIFNRRAQTEAKNATLAQQNADLAAKEQADLLKEIAGYSNPVINRSLKAIDQELPEGLVGSDAIKHVQTEISKGYTEELKRIGKVPFTKVQKGELESVLSPENLRKYPMLGEGEIRILEKQVANLQNAVGNKRTMTADQWQKTLQDLGDLSYNLRQGTNPEKDLGKAIYELKDRWMDILEKHAGSDRFKALNKAHSLLQAPQRAASYQKAILGGGDFTPEQLVAALKSEMPTKRFAAADDEALQEAINRFQEIGGRKEALKAAQAKRAGELSATQKRNLAEHDKYVNDLKLAKDKFKAGQAKRAEEVSLTQKRNLAGHENFVNDLKLAKGQAAENIKGNLGKATRGVQEAVAEPIAASKPGAFENWIGRGMAGLPIAKAMMLGGVGSVGLPVLGQTAALATIPGLATRGLYTNRMQSLKNLAVKPRSEETKAAAQKIRQSAAPIGGLGGYLAAPSTPPQTEDEEE